MMPIRKNQNCNPSVRNKNVDTYQDVNFVKIAIYIQDLHIHQNTTIKTYVSIEHFILKSPNQDSGLKYFLILGIKRV